MSTTSLRRRNLHAISSASMDRRYRYPLPAVVAELSAALLTNLDDKDPPLRMPFGSDTVATIEAKNAFVAQELAKWRELALSTDFPK